MAPEYGATIGFFPVDEQTLRYMRLTGRDEKLIDLVEHYCKEQGLWRDDNRPINYSSQLQLDLSTVEPSLAGPKRPQDRIRLSDMKSQWGRDLDKTYGKNSTTLVNNSAGGWVEEGGAPSNQVGNMPSDGGGASSVACAAVADAPPQADGVSLECDGVRFNLKHGDVVIAAITSCTNTSNPSVMIAAGLVAKKAVEHGAEGQALGQDFARARLAGRHRLSRQGRADQGSRRARLQSRGLRLHDLHRQLRPAA